MKLLCFAPTALLLPPSRLYYWQPTDCIAKQACTVDVLLMHSSTDNVYSASQFSQKIWPKSACAHLVQQLNVEGLLWVQVGVQDDGSDRLQRLHENISDVSALLQKYLPSISYSLIVSICMQIESQEGLDLPQTRGRPSWQQPPMPGSSLHCLALRQR